MLRNLIFSCALFGLSTPALSEEGKLLSLTIEKDGEFDLLYHRAESTATGAVLGGLIGAAIEEGIRSGDDSEKKKQVLNHITEPSCKNTFSSSLISKLTKAGYDVTTSSPEEKEKHDKSKLTINVKINSCGFKLVDSSTKNISAFIEFKAVIHNVDSNPFEEKFMFLGKNKYSFEKLLASESAIELEFNAVLARAGKRLANKIIYNKKG